MTNKAALRRTMRQRLNSVTAELRDSLSARICARLLTLDAVLCASAVGLYCAMAAEPDLTALTAELFERGKIVAFPRYSIDAGRYEMAAIRDAATDFVPGMYGVLEPAAELPALKPGLALEMTWVIPGLAFDRDGRRLGRGGGHYDRLLNETESVRIGVAFGIQIVNSVPAAAHDVPVDWVVTEHDAVECPRAAQI